MARRQSSGTSIHRFNRGRSGRLGALLACCAFAAPASADEWSARFLGRLFASAPEVTRLASSPAAEAVAPPESVDAAEARPAHWGLWQAETGPFPGNGLGLLSTDGIFAGEAGLETAAPRLGLGLHIQLSERSSLQGGVLSGVDADGHLSISPENRALALIASFRF